MFINSRILIVLAASTAGLALVLGGCSGGFAPTLPSPEAGPASIWGFVTEEGTGTPLSDVEGVTSDGVTLYSDTSGQDGGYAIADVPPGSRVASFAAAGYQTANYVVTVTEESTRLDPVLQSYGGPEVTNPPVINANAPVLNEASGTAVFSGTIDNLDSDTAVVILNGQQSVMDASGGTFNVTLILVPGTNYIRARATNAAGTAFSEEFTVEYTPPPGGEYYFRITLTWDRATDIDLHVWSPSDEHSCYWNESIGAGELDYDNTSGYGPENFTCDTLEDGRFKPAINYYSGSPAVGCVVRVTTGTLATGASVSEILGPFYLTAANHESGYPVTGNTASWWRPCDVLLSASGEVTVVAPDTSVGLSSVETGAAGIRTK